MQGFIKVSKLDRYRIEEGLIYETEKPSLEAELAMRLMGNLAIATMVPNGEDSTGRARYALMPATELVDRACDIAAAAFGRFRALGWVIEVPKPCLLDKDVLEKDDRQEKLGLDTEEPKQDK